MDYAHCMIRQPDELDPIQYEFKKVFEETLHDRTYDVVREIIDVKQSIHDYYKFDLDVEILEFIGGGRKNYTRSYRSAAEIDSIANFVNICLSDESIKDRLCQLKHLNVKYFQIMATVAEEFSDDNLTKGCYLHLEHLRKISRF